jgi:hypothetical protein
LQNNNEEGTSKPLEQGQGNTMDISSNTVNSSEASPPDFLQLSEICNQKYMLAKGILECKSACQPYECCFVKDGDCNFSASTCSRVSPCQNYFVPQDEKTVIEKECSSDAIENDPDPCLEVCEPYNCCFTEENCSAHISADCELYASCKILLDPTANENSSAETNDNAEPSNTLESPDVDSLQSSTSDTISESKLEGFCSPEELDKNWNACISYCESFACCFADSSCDKSKIECGDHSICAQFFAKPVGQSFSTQASTSMASTEPPEDDNQDDGPSYLQYTAVELAKACNSKQLSKDSSDCKLLCKGSACKSNLLLVRNSDFFAETYV